MSRETLEQKAGRLLTSGSVRVLELDADGHGRACVVGDNGKYVVEIGGNGRARCTCPAWGRCSHAAAVELVVCRNGDNPSGASSEGNELAALRVELARVVGATSGSDGGATLRAAWRNTSLVGLDRLLRDGRRQALTGYPSTTRSRPGSR